MQAASRVALRLTRLVGLKEQGPALLAAATELRTRAFTLVLLTYEEAPVVPAQGAPGTTPAASPAAVSPAPAGHDVTTTPPIMDAANGSVSSGGPFM